MEADREVVDRIITTWDYADYSAKFVDYWINKHDILIKHLFATKCTYILSQMTERDPYLFYTYFLGFNTKRFLYENPQIADDLLEFCTEETFEDWFDVINKLIVANSIDLKYPIELLMIIAILNCGHVVNSEVIEILCDRLSHIYTNKYHEKINYIVTRIKGAFAILHTVPNPDSEVEDCIVMFEQLANRMNELKFST